MEGPTCGGARHAERAGYIGQPPFDGRARTLSRLHGDEGGSISILTVFALLLFIMLLGMVMNVGRHADGKIRIQNAADAAAYSGGVVVARGMNALAFSNHLLFDVFALTAFMREADAQNSAQYVTDVLAAWNYAGGLLAQSSFPKFAALGQAIQQKTPQEPPAVQAFCLWASAASQMLLPWLESILSYQMIPEYQRAVVQVFPQIAQRAAMEVAQREGSPAHGRGAMLGALWRADVTLVGGQGELTSSSLPAMDPNNPAILDYSRYRQAARQQRRQLSHRYLRHWNDEVLVAFDYHRYGPAFYFNTAWMSQFSRGWRSFTCGYLNELLDQQYPDSNLPHVIHEDVRQYEQTVDCDDCLPRRARDYRGRCFSYLPGNDYLDRHFTFVGVCYWGALPEMMPGLFRNPTESDSLAYAAVRVFVPRSRLEWWFDQPVRPSYFIGGGGFPAVDPPADDEFPQEPLPPGHWEIRRQPEPQQWDLLNQYWACQLVPASYRSLDQILQTVPPLPEFSGRQFRLPRLGIDSTDMGRINTH